MLMIRVVSGRQRIISTMRNTVLLSLLLGLTWASGTLTIFFRKTISSVTLTIFLRKMISSGTLTIFSEKLFPAVR
jgi:hypothetical protein